LEVGAVTGYATAALADVSGPEQTLGKDAFLQLLITELSNQDPLQPMQDRDFIAQLAQLSTLEQMSSMNSGLEVLRLIQATAFVGKNVEAVASDGTRVSGAVTEVKFAESGPILVVEDKLVTLNNVLRVFAQQPETE
jgi:flagellar basal-body rod modification protein FlgD